MQNADRSSRRDVLKAVGLAGASAGVVLAGGSVLTAAGRGAVAAQPASPNRKRLARLAHMTDVHVEPELGAGEGLAACLRHLQSQPDKPEFILMTGDCVFDSFEQERSRTKTLWELWKDVWKQECSIPMMPLLGNHDCWGWNKTKSKTTGSEEGWGKKWACDELGLAKPYYSFDRAGWHFAMLDSVRPFGPEGQYYDARLEEEQMAWLTSDLAGTKLPTMVLSHIPILSITAFQGADVAKGEEKNTEINHSVMHTDWRELKALFAKNRQVKAALSGHVHLNDDVDYNGVRYICDGAVSGGWWKEANMGECECGYSLIDLYDDGTFEHRYVSYGWKYREK